MDGYIFWITIAAQIGTCVAVVLDRRDVNAWADRMEMKMDLSSQRLRYK